MRDSLLADASFASRKHPAGPSGNRYGCAGRRMVRDEIAVKVRLLGPPRVERGGSPVALDTRKAMALLAVLALVERPRPREVLAELLWPEHDAEHARGALRRTLSTLRSAIGADAVDATRDQVRLVRGPGLEIDVDRFR